MQKTQVARILKSEVMPVSNILRIQHEYAPGSKTCLVDGAFGSVGGSGDMLIHLFSEIPALPGSIEREIDDDGKLGASRPLDATEEVVHVRRVEFTARLTVEAARAVHAMLGRQLQQVDEHQQQLAAQRPDGPR